MPTALPQLDDHILHLLQAKHGLRTLDLMNELDPEYSESDVQRAVASLMSAGLITLTDDRKLITKDAI